MMIDEEPSPRASSDTRHALTVAFVKPGLGACWNYTRNSSSAMLYTLLVIGEETLSSFAPGKAGAILGEELGSSGGWGKLVGSTGCGSRPTVQWCC
jgi:hypothetical protein